MRSVILSMMLSLDGFIEGPNRELDWHNWDKEMDSYMAQFFERIDLLLFGRITYGMMLGYWPGAGSEDDPVITEKMNSLPKVVFSRILNHVEWNSRLADDIETEISNLKNQSAKDMVIFGGADLASSFIQHNLIDEYHLIINPTILGKGNPLFKSQYSKLRLRLLDAQAFTNGYVILRYEPIEKPASTQPKMQKSTESTLR